MFLTELSNNPAVCHERLDLRDPILQPNRPISHHNNGKGSDRGFETQQKRTTMTQQARSGENRQDDQEVKARLRKHFRRWSDIEWWWTCCFQSPHVAKLKLALIPSPSSPGNLDRNKRNKTQSGWATSKSSSLPVRLMNEILQLAPENALKLWN
ncbi:hypothetical protein ACA910_002617 [Epithemia clementina (nom. ined.)]